MSEIIIIYNGYPTIIQFQSNEKLKEIFKRFQIKSNVENKEIVYLYNGEIIKDDNIILSQLTSEKRYTNISINIRKNNNNISI